jgi:diaminopimelate decarboxylase
MYALTDTAAHETVTLVGNLCTAADEIAADIEMPVLSVGDVLVLTNAGAYAAVLSPMQFASQTPPAQLFLHADGTIEE